MTRLPCIPSHMFERATRCMACNKIFFRRSRKWKFCDECAQALAFEHVEECQEREAALKLMGGGGSA